MQMRRAARIGNGEERDKREQRETREWKWEFECDFHLPPPIVMLNLMSHFSMEDGEGAGGGVKILIFSFSGRYFWLLCVPFRFVWFRLVWFASFFALLFCFHLPNAFLLSYSHTRTLMHTLVTGRACSRTA